MESLKKVISLNQAAKQSGYTQDYLGYLIRKGELRGRKVGRGWFTTEEELKNYFFKQKVRHEKLPIRGFFSRRRTHNIVVITLLIFVGIFSVAFYATNKNIVAKKTVDQKLSSDVEVMETAR
jgi:hypothetical protein